MESGVKRAQALGERITVEDGRKAVVVLSWGELPLGQYLDKQGRSYVVPNNFCCFTREAKQELVGETRVTETMGRAQFRFSLFSNRSVSGEWKDNPTAALDCIHAKIKNNRHRVGANGLLVIGFKYPSLQQRIKEKFQWPLMMPSSSLPACSLSQFAPPPCRRPSTRRHSSCLASSSSHHTRARKTLSRSTSPEEHDACSLSVSKNPVKRSRLCPEVGDLEGADMSLEDMEWLDKFLNNEIEMKVEHHEEKDDDADQGLDFHMADDDLQPLSRVISTSSTILTLPMCSSMSDDEPSSDMGGCIERDYWEDDQGEDYHRKKDSSSSVLVSTQVDVPLEEEMIFDSNDSMSAILDILTSSSTNSFDDDD